MRIWLLTLLISFSFYLLGRPNIIWITCEDLSPDWLGCYGDSIVHTPHLDKLSRESIKYTRAYTTAGVCAPSRAAIITGMYQTSIGAHQMRTLSGAWGAKYSPVQSYSAVIPPEVRCFPEYLREVGYYCSNNEKQDYQFIPPVTVWDEQGPYASWEGRKTNQPLFAIFNVFITHESQLFSRLSDPLDVDPAKVKVPPFLPDTKIIREDIARLYTNVQIMDRQVGEIIARLKKADLYDQSYIFFYSDHGGMMPWTKREILERGTHIPLLIKFPGGKGAGTIDQQLISSIDLAPTVLSLAGIKPPAYLNGQAFLGKFRSKAPRKYVFAARDRMDTEYDRVRSVRDKQYRYIRNFMPEKPYYQEIEYRLSIPSMKEIIQLRNLNMLPVTTANWFKTKPAEELYDVQADPYEFNNLAENPQFVQQLHTLRKAYEGWSQTYADFGSIPEKEMIHNMWQGQQVMPETSKPKILVQGKRIIINCSTPGASLAYQIITAEFNPAPTKVIQSWDQGVVQRPDQQGKSVVISSRWEIYQKPLKIKLNPGDTLKVQAHRIGYAPAFNAMVGS